ncbi:hypothetical protein [Anaeromassilibacillus senegalensis]|uniref:Uncharacterized protein n=1 Tax=Anaeromassilibacillus senegalensis TaxID=1673717 RepID=A0ABS9CM93_9FIRM|nr:hypothetical protein [Anaeromassilibacillus senegalensis]MCF2652281.1 hypothetical protein [Anaeromassilibacillus senegalensis]
MEASCKSLDCYNTKLLDDTAELVEETDTYSQYRYTVIHNGQEMDAYYFDQAGTWSDWYEDEYGNHECKFTIVEEFLVPVGYDGCVVSMANSRLEWPDGSYITDLDPDEFLLFRLN